MTDDDPLRSDLEIIGFAEMYGGRDDVARLLGHIRIDLDRYLARVASPS